MSTIHKYVLHNVTTAVPTFEGARFLHVDNQREQITVWAEVDPMRRECLRALHVVGTGHEVPPATDYVGSVLVQDGTFVFHIYAAPDRVA